MELASVKAVIRARTRLARPALTPEIRHYAADSLLEIWRATEQDLQDLGLGAPFWAFAWPGGQALARHLLDQPECVRGRVVIAIGAGAGLEAVAAARAGARRVVANDIDPAACAAAQLNAEANDVRLETCGCDLLADPASGLLDPRTADLVLVGDALYEAGPAAALTALLADASARGAEILIGDPDRGRLPERGMREIATYDVPVDRDLEDVEIRRARVYAFSP